MFVLVNHTARFSTVDHPTVLLMLLLVSDVRVLRKHWCGANCENIQNKWHAEFLLMHRNRTVRPAILKQNNKQIDWITVSVISWHNFTTQQLVDIFQVVDSQVTIRGVVNSRLQLLKLWQAISLCGYSRNKSGCVVLLYRPTHFFFVFICLLLFKISQKYYCWLHRLSTLSPQVGSIQVV